jgi:hypothetical protein
MTPLENTAVATESTATETDGESAAVEFAQGDATETETESAPAVEAKKPEPTPTPETILAEAQAEKKAAVERLEKVNSQLASFERQKSKFAEREARLIEREKAVENLSSVSDITAHLAKLRGVTDDEIWQEWAEEIKGGGKPSDATIAKRERDKYKRELDESKELATKREQEQSQAVVQQWGTEMDGILGAEAFKTSYPRLANVPGVILVDALVAKTKGFQADHSGALPRHADLLAFLESQCPEAEPAKPAVTEAAKPKTKPRIPTESDASASVGSRELSEAEREELAIEYASSL